MKKRIDIINLLIFPLRYYRVNKIEKKIYVLLININLINDQKLTYSSVLFHLLKNIN